MIYNSMVLDFSISSFLAGKWRQNLLGNEMVFTERVSWDKLKTEKKFYNILIQSGDIVKWILSKFYF